MTLTRCDYGDKCRKRNGITGCRYIHPDEPEYEHARESSYKFGRRAENASAYVAEAKSGSFNDWDKQSRQRPQHKLTGTNNTSLAAGSRKWGNASPSSGPQAQASSGDLRHSSGGVGGSSSRSSGQGALGGGGGWPPAGDQMRDGGRVQDRPEEPSSSSNLFPTAWDSTPGPSEPTGWSTSSSNPWGASAGTLTVQSPTQQSTAVSGDGTWPTTENDSSTNNLNDQQPVGNENKDEGNPWASISTEDTWNETSWSLSLQNIPSSSNDKGKERTTNNGIKGWGETSPERPQPSPFVSGSKGKSAVHGDVEMTYLPMESSAPPTPTPTMTTPATHPPLSRPLSSIPAHPASKPALPTRKPRVSSNLVPEDKKVPAAAASLPTRLNSTPMQQKMQEVLTKKETAAKRKSLTQPADYYKGPEGRKRLYSHLIYVMITTVSIHSRKKKAETRYYQVKAMAQSPQYGRGTFQTRAILDAALADAKREMTTLQNMLTENIEELAIIPDFTDDSKKPKPRDPRSLMRSVIGYTAELQEWFQELQLDGRTSVDKPVNPKPSAPPATAAPKPLGKDIAPKVAQPTPPTPISLSSVPSPAVTPKELLEQGEWTWQEVKDALRLMHTRIQDADEEIHSTLSKTLDEQARERLANEIEATIEGIIQNMASEEEEETEKEKREEGEVKDVLAREARNARQLARYRDQFITALICVNQLYEKLDEGFRDDISQLSDVVRHKHEMQQEIASWRTQREALENFNAEASAKLAEMKLWNTEAAAKLNELREKAQQLAAMKDQVVKATEQPAAPQFDYDALVELIHPVLMQRVRREVQPVLQGLQAATTQYQADMIEKVDQLVQPAIRSTNELCAKAILAKNNSRGSV